MIDNRRTVLGPKFHVLLTSYETVLNDKSAFRGLKFEVGGRRYCYGTFAQCHLAGTLDSGSSK